MATLASTIRDAALIATVVLVGAASPAQEHPEPASTAVVEAGSVADRGPEAAFEKFMGAMREGDWAGCSRMMHPDALAQFHSTFSALAQADDSGEVARTFFGVESGADVVALSPEAAFEQVMRGLVAMNPGMSEMFGTASAKILGTVPEGEVVHVVYRMSMEIEGGSVSKLAVAPFQRHDGEWRALLTGDMQGMIDAIQGQLGS